SHLDVSFKRQDRTLLTDHRHMIHVDGADNLIPALGQEPHIHERFISPRGIIDSFHDQFARAQCPEICTSDKEKVSDNIIPINFSHVPVNILLHSVTPFHHPP